MVILKTKILIPIVCVLIIVILFGIFIPIDSYSTMTCKNFNERQDLIFGGKLEPIKNQNYQNSINTTECGLPRTFKLYVL